MNANDQNARLVRRHAEDAAALFPALLVEAERISQTVIAGLHGRRRAGPGETFWQHRAYGFGDAVSTIDWRQSARIADRLYVRENEWEAAAAIYIWRDPSRSLDYSSAPAHPTKRRRADILSVALSILLSQAGERVGILGQERRPYHGRNTPSRILEALINEDGKASSVPPVAHLPVGARIVMISDFFSDVTAIRNSVDTLASEGAKGVLLQLCDPAEEDFPFHGRVEFADLESADKITFGETRSIQSAYKDNFAAHRKEVEFLARRAGWTFITHRTDKPPQTALLALYAALGDIKNGGR